MTFDKWLNDNNDYLIQVTKNITSNSEDTMDLYQSVMTQLLLQRDKLDPLPDKEKLYYFIKVTKTNYFSKTSPYQYQKKKYEKQHTEYNDFKDLREDISYMEDIPDMIWVEKTLDEMGWFERDLFTLYMEYGTMVAVHKETTIPINSVGKYIKEIKNDLKQRWIKEKGL